MQYFKDKIELTSVLFLQETHSGVKFEQNWNKDFKGPVFFSRKVKFLWRINSLLWDRNVYCLKTTNR